MLGGLGKLMLDVGWLFLVMYSMYVIVEGIVSTPYICTWPQNHLNDSFRYANFETGQVEVGLSQQVEVPKQTVR